ncbi:MAG: hypothetical protein ACRD68_06045 [Pyrinomonadaceae bacterium]
MSKYIFQPPSVKKKDEDSAWAAALNSFFRVTAGVVNTTQSELITAFGSSSGGLPTFLSDSRRGLNGLKTKLLTPQGVKVDRVGKLLLADAIEDNLHSSHVVLLHSFGPPPHFGTWNPHAWLVYGIDNWIIYMDGDTGLLPRKQKLTGFTSEYVQVIWRPQ